MQKARSRRARRHTASTACRCTGSGTISLPCQGYFSPFPHGTGSLSVAKTYVALRDGPRRFPQGFSCPGVLGDNQLFHIRFCIRGFYSLWRDFPDPFATRLGKVEDLRFFLWCPTTLCWLSPQAWHTTQFRHQPLSLAATKGIAIAFSSSGY